MLKPQLSLHASDNTNRTANLAWVIFCFFGLCVLIPSLLLITVADEGRGSAWIGTLLVMLWAGLRLSILIGQGLPKMLQYFWWLFAYVFLGLAPCVQLRTGSMPSTTPGVSATYDWPAVGIVLMGILFWEFGAQLARSRRLAVSEVPDYSVNVQRVRILALVGIGTSAYFVAKMGLGAFLLTRDKYGSARGAIWPDLSISSIVFALSVYVSLLVAHGLRNLPPGSGSLGFGSRLILCLSAAAALVIANPIGNARYVAGTVLLSLVVLMGFFGSKLRTRTGFAAALFGFLFVFPVADAFRRENFSATRDGFFAEYAGSGDYDAFAQINNTISMTASIGIEPGRQLMGSLFFWVPRSIWPDKPLDTGVVVATFQGYEFTNLSAPLWAEFWVNGGPFLLAIGFLLIGFWSARWDQTISASLLSPQGGFWSVVGSVLPFYLVILLRGSLLQATGALAVIVFATLFLRSSKSAYIYEPNESSEGSVTGKRRKKLLRPGVSRDQARMVVPKR